VAAVRVDPVGQRLTAAERHDHVEQGERDGGESDGGEQALENESAA
jgi:hypothetical protein